MKTNGCALNSRVQSFSFQKLFGDAGKRIKICNCDNYKLLQRVTASQMSVPTQRHAIHKCYLTALQILDGNSYFYSAV